MMALFLARYHYALQWASPRSLQVQIRGRWLPVASPRSAGRTAIRVTTGSAPPVRRAPRAPIAWAAAVARQRPAPSASSVPRGCRLGRPARARAPAGAALPRGTPQCRRVRRPQPQPPRQRRLIRLLQWRRARPLAPHRSPFPHFPPERKPSRRSKPQRQAQAPRGSPPPH